MLFRSLIFLYSEHLFEIVPPVFAVPVGWPWCSGRLRLVLIGAIERNGGGILMESGRRQGIDLQRFEGHRTKHLIEVGRKQRIEDVP